MRYSVHVSPRSGITEYKGGKGSPIKATGRIQNLLAEMASQLCQSVTPRGNRLPRQIISADNDRTAITEHTGNRTFPGSNTTGDTKNHKIISRLQEKHKRFMFHNGLSSLMLTDKTSNIRKVRTI
jgi:hypothetical protein